MLILSIKIITGADTDTIIKPTRLLWNPTRCESQIPLGRFFRSSSVRMELLVFIIDCGTCPGMGGWEEGRAMSNTNIFQDKRCFAHLRYLVNRVASE